MKTLDDILQEQFTTEQRTEITRKAKEKIATIRLKHVRKAHHVTQKALAQSMGLSQSALSELERRPNITLNVLQRYIEALGGRVEIRAIFSEGAEELLV